VSFGPFVLDTCRMELQRAGVVLPLRPKPFALLCALAGNPGRVLGKESLFAAVWPGVVVSDDSLTQAVREVRAALGDEGATILRTVARHGYRFDAEVVDTEVSLQRAPADANIRHPVPSLPAPPPALSRRWRRPGVLVLAGLALVAGLVGVGELVGGALERPAPWRGRFADADRDAAPRLSLVVLPLEVEAGSDSFDWFGDPLTMDLTLDLGKVSGLFVISRETAYSYKGRQFDPRVVSRELNVRYVVRGSVARTGNEVRLAVGLIDGASGRLRWAERFVLDRADLAASLRGVADVISRSLGAEIYRAEGQRAATLRPEHVQADDLAMQGWAVWMRGLSPENAVEALRLFDEAVARDPDSLRGWSGVGMVNGQAANLGWLADPAPARARQREALLQMERIDSDDMLTHFARVDPYYRAQDFAGLLQLAQALVHRFPNQPWSHHQHASALMRLGRFDECIAPAEQALRLGPRDTLKPLVRGMATFCHLAAGRAAEAESQARLMVQENPTQTGPQMLLAAALASGGRHDEALAIVHSNQGRVAFAQHALQRLLTGPDPNLAMARERLFATLAGLGVPSEPVAK
jgi:TolB-like protein/DNA-binding winged helix-turn-helix (wHTH) protein